MKSDLLYPIKDNNRNEHIIVEYETFIKNITEGMMLTLLEDKESAIINFPKIEKYFNMNKQDLYYSTCLHTPEEFILSIIPENNTYGDMTELWKIVDNLLSRNNIINQERVIFEYALYKLSSEDFVKSITIIKKRPFLNYEIEHLSKLFDENLNKMTFMYGNIYEEVSRNKSKYTTIGVSNAETLFLILDTLSEEELKEILFILNSNHENCYINTDSANFIQYKLTNEINNHKAANKNITRMFPFIIDDELLSQINI